MLTHFRLLADFDRERSCHHFVDNKAKGRILKRVFQENKASQIFRKTNISHVRVYIRGLECSFCGKFGVLCLLETPALRLALLPYYQRHNLFPIMDTLFFQSQNVLV